MSYIPTRAALGFTADEEHAILAAQDAQAKEMQRVQDLLARQERLRKIALYATAGGALFAAIRLGIIFRGRRRPPICGT